jgi:hypothetical protein
MYRNSDKDISIVYDHSWQELTLDRLDAIGQSFAKYTLVISINEAQVIIA